MSPDVTSTWAGSPSRIAARAGPWDSPAVSQRSMPQVFHGARRPRTGVSSGGAGVEVGDLATPDDADQRPEQHERAERVGLAVDDAQQREQRAADPPEQESRVDTDQKLAPPEVAQGDAQQPRQPHVAVPHAARVDQPEQQER